MCDIFGVCSREACVRILCEKCHVFDLSERREGGKVQKEHLFCSQRCAAMFICPAEIMNDGEEEVPCFYDQRYDRAAPGLLSLITPRPMRPTEHTSADDAKQAAAASLEALRGSVDDAEITISSQVASEMFPSQSEHTIEEPCEECGEMYDTECHTRQELDQMKVHLCDPCFKYSLHKDSLLSTLPDMAKQEVEEEVIAEETPLTQKRKAAEDAHPSQGYKKRAFSPDLFTSQEEIASEQF